MTDVLSDQLTANFLKAAIVTLRNEVVPALSTPESRINADLVTRVLYMLESRFSRRGEDLKELLARDQALYGQISALLATSDASPEIPLQPGETFSAIEKLESQVFQQEAKIIGHIPDLIDAAKKAGPERESALGCLRRMVDIQKAFLAAQDPDILNGSDVCYQGGKISEERHVERADIFGQELTSSSLENHLQSRFPGAQVSEFSPMAGGFSKTTIFFTLAHPGGNREKLVIRKDIPTDYISSVAYEFPLLQQLYNAGFAVAEPRWLEHDPAPFGGRFMVSRRVEGSTDISRWASNPEMVDNFARQLAKVMADLHNLPLEALGYPGEIASKSAGELMEAEIQRWYGLFKQSTREARPVIELAVAWIKAHMPQSAYSRPGRLVHGDIGFHNLMIANGKVTALLDWEFSHPGDPVEDLLYVKTFVEKVMDWDTFKSYYREYGGQPFTAEEEFFYSVWAKTRNPLSSVLGTAVFADTLQDNIKFASSCYVLARYLEVEAGYVILDSLEK